MAPPGDDDDEEGGGGGSGGSGSGAGRGGVPEQPEGYSADLPPPEPLHPSVEKDAGQGLTLVHFSAQPEPFLTQNTP